MLEGIGREGSCNIDRERRGRNNIEEMVREEMREIVENLHLTVEDVSAMYSWRRQQCGLVKKLKCLTMCHLTCASQSPQIIPFF